MILLPFLLALTSLMSQQVFLNNSPLCSYLEKVFAEGQNDFEGFRGKESDVKGEFVGTFKLAPRSECRLYPRREGDGMAPPEYSCTFGERYFFSEAQTTYDLNKEGLRACLSGFVFEERRRGGETTGSASWTFRGYKPGGFGVQFVLRLNDLTGKIAASAGKATEEITGATVVVDIRASTN